MPAGVSVSYINVTDSDNDGLDINAWNGTNVNGRNNTGWDFINPSGGTEMYVTGTILATNSDYLTSVSAVNMEVNGQMVYITYIDSSGNLKAASKSFVTDANGLPIIMSGCSIVQ